MKLNRLLLFPSFLLVCACASVVPPSGGPADTEPPKITRQIPENGSTRFTGNQVSIEFDEYLNTSADPAQVIVSPSPGQAPDIEINRKKVTVNFKEKLKENTTYSVFFGELIKDNHEGNTLSGYTVVFSTGPEIDKGFLSGRVTDAFSLETKKDVTVCLYSYLADSAPFTLKPDYISRTKEDGSYAFNNLPSRSFRLFAFQDANRNLMCDPGEAFAFQSEPLSVQSDSQQVPLLRSFTYLPREAVKLVRFHKRNEFTYVFGFNQSIADSQVMVVPEPQPSGFGLEKTHIENDSLYFYYYPSVLSDSLVLNVFCNNRVIGREVTPFKKAPENRFILKKAGESTDILDIGDTLSLMSERPVKSIKKEKISLLESDSIPVKQVNLAIDEKNPHRIFILFTPVPGKKYTLRADDTSFSDYTGSFNKAFKTSLTVSEEKRYGSLTFEVQNDNSQSFVIQLINEKGTLIRTHPSQKTEMITESWLKPGNYRIKIIWDKNQNGKWDSGDFQTHTQPEMVFIQQGPVTIKPNWDVSDMRITPRFP